MIRKTKNATGIKPRLGLGEQLVVGEVAIEGCTLHELGVGAGSDDLTPVKHDDLV